MPPAPTTAPRASRSEPPGLRGTWVEVDLAAIRSNVRCLRAWSTAPSLMAVVKADGYGHGLVQAARAAVEGGADHLGVALVEEGIALRRCGIDVPVLVLSEPPIAALPALVASGLTATVCTEPFAVGLDAAARHLGTRARAHVKLDTGMHRVGVREPDWEAAFAVLARCRHLDVEGIWSHLSSADDPSSPETDRQAAALHRGCAVARAAGLRPAVRHLASSAAALLRPDLHLDLVRCGLATYGLCPAPAARGVVPLVPALSWFARLTQVKALPAGAAVGYGQAWRAPADTVVGTVAAGYADGLDRHLSHVGHAAVGGRRVPFAGRISMDQAVLDLGAGALEQVGDEVALLGGRVEDPVTADDWAGWLGTISYEVVTRIGARVPRVHVDLGS